MTWELTRWQPLVLISNSLPPPLLGAVVLLSASLPPVPAQGSRAGWTQGFGRCTAFCVLCTHPFFPPFPLTKFQIDMCSNLWRSTLRGHVPKPVLPRCPKSIIRSQLWQGDRDSDSPPTAWRWVYTAERGFAPWGAQEMSCHGYCPGHHGPLGCGKCYYRVTHQSPQTGVGWTHRCPVRLEGYW